MKDPCVGMNSEAYVIREGEMYDRIYNKMNEVLAIMANEPPSIQVDIIGAVTTDLFIKQTKNPIKACKQYSEGLLYQVKLNTKKLLTPG